jgi:hypothetical protein
MTAETEPRAGSDLRPVLHNESRKQCRGQQAERSDASSAEVLSKLIQVPTEIANGTFRKATFTAQILCKPWNLRCEWKRAAATIASDWLLAGQLQHLPHATLGINRTLAHSNGRLCLGPMLLQPLRNELLYISLAGRHISATLPLCELGEVKKQRHPPIHDKARVTM